MSDDTLGNIKVLKWPELPQTSDEHNIDGLIHALLEAETAEQIIGCRNELLTAWMGWQARGAQPDSVTVPRQWTDAQMTAAKEMAATVRNALGDGLSDESLFGAVYDAMIAAQEKV